MAGTKTTVKNISHKSLKDRTRVIIELSGPTEFIMNHLSEPERFYFDLKNTTISKKIRTRITIEDGILKGVRVSQFSKDIVRVVFDLDRGKDFKASLINKKAPQLVIDIYHSKTPKEQGTASKKETAETASQKELAIVSSIPKKELDIPQPSLTQPETSTVLQHDASSLISSGGKYLESGEYEKAVEVFKKAAELSPRNPEIYLSIGRALFRLGQREDALEAYKKALEYDQNSADAYNGLGYTYYSLANPGSAVESFLTAIKLNPEHDDAHAGLGYTYLTMGDIDAAMKQYRILKGLGSNKADDLLMLIFKEQNKNPK